MARKQIKLKINRREFDRQVSRVRTAPKIKELAYKRAQEIAEDAKKELKSSTMKRKITMYKRKR